MIDEQTCEVLRCTQPEIKFLCRYSYRL